MATPASYIICGTPRTGSTFLCSLLTSTCVAGRPESYFREPDEHRWAERFGVHLRDGGTAAEYAKFVAGARRTGSTPNGVFAARVMWGTMDRLVDGLHPHRGSRRDIVILADAFGPLRFVHLGRSDVVAQAVSWARSEQTGVWQHGDVASCEATYDPVQIAHLVGTIRDHELAWRDWFSAQGIVPLELTYEHVIDAPRDAVVQVLRLIGAELPNRWVPTSPHHRQADALNAGWIARFHASNT